MKRTVKILIASVLLLTAVGARAQETWNLNRGWKFHLHSETGTDNARLVDLPHTWNTDAFGPGAGYHRGMGHYHKEFEVPAGWQGKRLFLKCGGAGTVADIFVNGQHLGQHRGATAGFTIEITRAVTPGRKNHLHVVVSNSPRYDVLPTAGDATVYGGLFRDMELRVCSDPVIYPANFGCDGVRILQRKVTPQRGELEAIIDVSSLTDVSASQVVVSVRDAEGNSKVSAQSRVKLSGGGVSTVRIPLTLDSPRLWNGPQDPYLYSVTVKVSDGKKFTDSITISTGLRSVAVHPQRGFLLNDAPYRIKGFTVHCDRPVRGNAITEYDVREDFAILLETGANAVRIAGGKHHPLFYELCDEHGIVVWNDFPLIGSNYFMDLGYIETPAYRENARKQSISIVRQLFNHPSVVMWGLFSDMNFRGDDPLSFLKELNADIHYEDPSRPTVASSNEDGEINHISDLIVWNHHLGWLEGQPSDIRIWAGQYHGKWPQLRAAVAYQAGGSIHHQSDTLRRPEVLSGRHSERWQTHFHETYLETLGNDTTFWGLFAGNLFEYGAAGRSHVTGNGVNDCGLVTFDRRHRKDSFYLYKALWNPEEPFVWITGKRWDHRRRTRHTITVYSSLEAVELFLNGESLGTCETLDGIHIWENVRLSVGKNTLEAVSGGYTDKAVVYCGPDAGRFL